MQTADKSRFMSLLADVHSFYEKEFSAFSGSVWWSALQVFDFEAVAEAFSRWSVNPDRGQFMPKPADVVRMLEGSTEDSALAAWAKVDKSIRTVGTYASVAFDDPLIHTVIVDMGGWLMLGQKTEADWPFLRNEFVARYRGFRERHESPPFNPVLKGIAAVENERIGQGNGSASVVLIGDAVKALLVSQQSGHSGLQITREKPSRPLLVGNQR